MKRLSFGRHDFDHINIHSTFIRNHILLWGVIPIRIIQKSLVVEDWLQRGEIFVIKSNNL